VIAAPRKSSIIVVVTLAANSAKKTLFTLESGASRFVKRSDIPNTEVAECYGLGGGFCHAAQSCGDCPRVRRCPISIMNSKWRSRTASWPANVSTVFLMPHERYTYLNSSIVREVARHGGAVDCFVPDLSRRALSEQAYIRRNVIPRIGLDSSRGCTSRESCPIWICSMLLTVRFTRRAGHHAPVADFGCTSKEPTGCLKVQR